MLQGWEWLIIGAVVIAIILFGPSKLPEFAKALTHAKDGLGKTQKEFTLAPTLKPKTPPQKVQSVSNAFRTPRVTIKSGDELLFETAQRMGLQTQGKTREQLRKEISKGIG